MLPTMMNTVMPFAPNTWTVWVNHIMKHKKVFSIRKAAILRYGGGTAASTSGFLISDNEIAKIRLAFQNPGDIETVKICGKTYVLKSKAEKQIVGFNGSKYIIICRSNVLLTVVQMETKEVSDAAARWLHKVNNRLIEKGF